MGHIPIIMIDWVQFNHYRSTFSFLQDTLPDTNFSIWKWVFACMNLIKEHLKKEWNAGSVYILRHTRNVVIVTCNDSHAFRLFLIMFCKMIDYSFSFQ